MDWGVSVKPLAQTISDAPKNLARLAAEVAKAERNLLLGDDERTLKSLHKQVSAMRDELDRLNAELAAGPEEDGYSEEDLAALTEYLAGL